MKNDTIGNQQERLLWWIGGIIDADGCITINHHRLHKNSHRETLLFSPTIIIVNTNKIIIDTCIKALENSEIPHYISYTKPAKTHWKPKWSITITGLKRVSKALTILSKYIIGKYPEAKLVKRFCDIRLNAKRVKTSYGNFGNCPYGDEEFEIIYEVAKIHNRNPQRLYAEIRKYKSKIRPDIIRNKKGQFAKQDIVRPAVRAAE